jgi:uncharacterized protein YraI
MLDKEQQQVKELHQGEEPQQNGEQHQNMVKCRQTHSLQRRAGANAAALSGENQKAITIVLAVCGGALLLLGVGILVLGLPFLRAQLAKWSCPEGEECNVKVRKYKNEVLADITDLSPSWFPETPTATTRMNITCRSGPTAEYPILDYLKPGTVLNVVGRNRAWDSWMVDDPHIGRTCWVYGERVELAGDAGKVPVVQVGPPPVPVPSDTPLSCRDYTDGSSCVQHGCTWDKYYQPNGRCK